MSNPPKMSLAEHETIIKALRTAEDSVAKATIELGCLLRPTPEQHELWKERNQEWIQAALLRLRAERARNTAYPEAAFLRRRTLDKPLTEPDYFVTPNQYY
jgi:hypothetical protein